MTIQHFVSTDEIRAGFSRAMSDMYRQEVPQYGTLMRLVEEVNEAGLARDPALRDRLAPGEKIGWFMVYNGDPDRWYPPSEDEDEYEDEESYVDEKLNSQTEGQTEPGTPQSYTVCI